MPNEIATFTALVGDLLTYLRQEHLLSPQNLSKSVETKPTYFDSKKATDGREKITEQPKEKENNKILEPPVPIQKSEQIDDLSMRQLILRVLPELKLTDKIPSDAKAKALAELYKHKAPQVALLTEKPEELPFLKALAKAIHTQLKPAKILGIDKIQPADSLRLFIATHAGVASHPAFKESPTPTLFGIPLILLAPISEYEKNPSLKRALWDHLCQILR